MDIVENKFTVQGEARFRGMLSRGMLLISQIDNV